MSHMNRRKLKAVALLLAGLAFANSAWALNAGDILTITQGTCAPILTFAYPGPTPPYPAGSGSCFGMITSQDADAGEQNVAFTRIRGYNGIIIGTVQPGGGTHLLPPNGSESPGIDMPWSYFGNSGLHYTTVPITELVPNSVLDFSGWIVSWSTTPSIPMVTGAHSGFTNGQAQITCAPANCANGATYTLAYTATVPSPCGGCGFDGVSYSLRLEGTVIVPAGPMSAPVGIIGGLVGGAGGSIRVTAADLQAFGAPADTGFANSGGYYDFVTPTTPGGLTQVVLPLTAALPAGFVYRKYSGTAWHTFVEDANNRIESASVAPGLACPAPGNGAYHAAIAGDNCLQLTIQDGGPNDANSVASSVSDPGGVATVLQAPPALAVSGSSGCSLSANPVNPLERGDWWLLLGFVAWMGFVIRRKRA
jgi:hypothetical protein